MKTSKLISAVCFWLSSFGVYAQPNTLYLLKEKTAMRVL